MDAPPKKTALYGRHVANKGRIVEFAGWMMPVWFTSINEEHAKVRTAVGVFDVSHMGQVAIRGDDALRVAEFLVAGNVTKLARGRAMYTVACNRDGGIVDDLIVYKRSERDILLCVNAGTTEKDIRHFVENNPGAAVIENVSDRWSQLAVQGPKSYRVLEKVWPSVAATLKPFDFQEVEHEGVRLIVAGTGYTGERGYELYVPWEAGPKFFDLFMAAGKEEGIAPVGLGARDTLRLEAKFCLYGNDIDDSTNPIEAGLGWVVDLSSDFLGREHVVRMSEQGARRKLVGFEMVERGIPRQHCPVFVGAEKVGEVTSGNTSPTLGKAIGLAYVADPHHKRGTELEIEIRGRRVRAAVVKTPFYKAQG